MKKLITSIALLCATTTAFANSATPQNVVQRPMVLSDGEFQAGAALMYGEETDGGDQWQFAPYIAYGVTDDLTLGLGHARYRFLERSNDGKGLELTTGLGFTGHREVFNADDSYGVGFDISGKYVMTKDTAFLFSTQYVHWNEDKRDNRSEMRYSVGVQQNVFEHVTLFADYTFSDLKDFNDNSAQSGTIGANYALSKTTDVGMFVHYSDFDAEKNGYKADNVFEKSAGVFLSMRF